MAKYHLTAEELKELERISKGLPDVPLVPAVDPRLKTCSKCNKPKTRIFQYKTEGGLKKYNDDKGRPWRGRKCPDCSKILKRLYMRRVRGTKQPRVN